MSKKISVMPEKTALVAADEFTILDSQTADAATKNKRISKTNALIGVTQDPPAAGNKLRNQALWVAAGGAATLNVGTTAGTVAGGDAPAAAVTAHNAAYDHANLPSAAQKAALNASPTASSANAYATINDIVDEGAELKSTGQLAQKILVTDGAGGFAYEAKPAGGTVSTFTDLTDTPASYAGQGGKAVRVNAGATALEFVAAAGLPEAPVDGEIYARKDAGWVLSPISPVSATATHYYWDSTTAESSPAPGYVRVNNATPTLATELYINATSRFGNSTLITWTALQAGDYLGIWEEGTDRAGITYRVTGAPTNGTTWVTVPVEAVPGSTGGFTNDVPVTVHTALNPANKLPLGGTIGQTLTKDSGTDFDVSWQDAGGGLTAVEDDPAPRLGGNLQLVGNRILITDVADQFHGALGYSPTVAALFLSENTPGEYFEEKGGISFQNGLTALHGTGAQIKAMVGVGDRQVYADPDGNLYPVDPPTPAWDEEDSDAGSYTIFADVGTGPWVKMTGLSITTTSATDPGADVRCTTRAWVANAGATAGAVEFAWGVNAAEPTVAGVVVPIAPYEIGYVNASKSVAAAMVQPIGVVIQAWARRVADPAITFGCTLNGNPNNHTLLVEVAGSGGGTVTAEPSLHPFLLMGA